MTPQEMKSAVLKMNEDSWHKPALGIPATGKQVQFSGCSIYHFRDGKIVEQWEYGDLLGLMQCKYSILSRVESWEKL